MNETPKDEREYVTEQWVYAGFKRKPKQLLITFLPVVNGKPDQANVYNFTVKKKPLYAIGGLYEIACARFEPDSLTARFNTLKYIKQWPDQSFVSELRTEQTINDAQFDNDTLERKYAQGLELPTDWNELVRIYAGLSYHKKMVFEQLLVSKLRSDREKLRRVNK